MRTSTLTSLALLAALVVGAPQPVGASGVVAEWQLRPVNPGISWGSPGGGTRTVTSGVTVKGGLNGGQLDQLFLHVFEAGPDGTEELLLGLSGPVGLLTRPGALRTASSSGVDLHTGRSECGEEWLDLEDVGVDGSGRLTRFSLDWWSGCGAHGSVRWGYPGDEAAPTEYSFPPTPVDDFHRAVHVVVDDWTATTARVEGPNPADFPLVAGLLCEGAGPCRVPVAFVPRASGHRRAILVLEGDGRAVRVPLEGMALPGRSEVTVDGQVITPADGFVRFGGAGWSFSGEAIPDDPALPGWTFHFAGPDLEPLREGVRYVDTGYSADGTEIGVMRRQDGHSSWIGCGSNHSRGWFEFRQLFQAAGQTPAYVVDFHHECLDGAVHAGTIEYLARADVLRPGPADSLAVVDGVLRWSRPADAVRTVVRARPGGRGIGRPDQGRLLHSGSGTRVALPPAFRGRSARFTLFTLDASGNVSTAASTTTRGRTAVTLRRDGSVLRGLVTDAGWGHRSPGRTLVLQSRRPGGTWQAVRTGASDPWGRVAFTVNPPATREFRVRAEKAGLLDAAWSPVVRFVVG